MKQRFLSRSRTLDHQSGVTMVLVALAMVAIIAMAAISIDVITLYLAREEAQRAADTAALAAARVISLSGITGDPNTASSWQAICGSSGPATLAAKSVALQNVVGAATANTVNITYGGGTAADCSSLITGSPNTFSTNPTVTVQVQRTNLPNFFSRIWSRSGTNISASATAEVFNPSYSGQVTGTVVPVQPICVKPWFVPNYDPLSVSGCTTANCKPFVVQSNGNIQNPGISLNGANANGVIGESFWLGANCTHDGAGCVPRATPIQANYSRAGYVQGPPNLLYYPGQAPTATPVGVPAACSGGGAGGQPIYELAVAGCDQSTVYQCGVPSENIIDMSENPATQNGDVATGVQCLTHQGSTNGPQPDGQDVLIDSAFPFQIQAGSSNPLISAGVTSGTQISSSNSVVSLPIYDSTDTVGGSGSTNPVTVVGFLQVFINQVDDYDNVNITVLNVSGCGSGPVGSNPVAGTSPVPIRLITPP